MNSIGMAPCAVSVRTGYASVVPLATPRRTQHILYHGTSSETAAKIQREGFKPSASGCLGPGTYVARADKASKFAANCSRHGGASGAVVKVRITFQNAKYVRSDDKSWRSEGYDACRTDRTSLSDNPEWCLASPSQVEVLEIRQIPCGEQLPAFEAELLALHVVRRKAGDAGLKEVYQKMEDSVVSFATDAEAAGSARVDVYYATGTVVVKPHDGSNRRYVKRKVDVFSLVDIFRQLVGDCDCHQPPKRPRPSSSLSGNPQWVNRHGPADPEDKAVRGVLASLQRDAAEAQAVLDDGAKRREEAARREAEAKLREAEARRHEAARKEKEERQRAALLAERADRGVNYTACLADAELNHLEGFFSEKTLSVAIDGNSAFLVHEGGGWDHSGGVTPALHELMYGTARRPAYVALGTNHRYYIQFTDGSSEWSANCGAKFAEAARVQGEVQTVAFGKDGTWFIVHKSGWWHANAIPTGLSRHLGAPGDPGVKCVSLGPNGEWFLMSPDGRFWFGGLRAQSTLRSHLAERRIQGNVKFIDFGPQDRFFVRYG